MNHDEQLQQVGIWLKVIMNEYQFEIDNVKDPKQHAALIEEFDKAKHFMIKMGKYLDEMNCWFTAFGLKGRPEMFP